MLIVLVDLILYASICCLCQVHCEIVDRKRISSSRAFFINIIQLYLTELGSKFALWQNNAFHSFDACTRINCCVFRASLKQIYLFDFRLFIWSNLHLCVRACVLFMHSTRRQRSHSSKKQNGTRASIVRRWALNKFSTFRWRLLRMRNANASQINRHLN